MRTWIEEARRGLLPGEHLSKIFEQGPGDR
jgi:hypothetical protein